MLIDNKIKNRLIYWLMKKVTIIGAGWLGLPLAIKFKDSGYHVHGTTTQKEKKEILEKHTINATVFDAYKTNFDEINWNVDILIITIPFKRNLIDPFVYPKMIENIYKHIYPNTLLVFTSSTSVYPAHISNCNEQTELTAPRSDREIALHDSEKIIQKHTKYLILRLSGLYGPGREPGKFLAQKTSIPDQPVNLIHLDDIIEIIMQLISKNITNEIFNLTQDIHPLKSEFYTLAAQKKGLAIPSFTHSNIQKIVSNQKLKNALNYEFIHPNPMADI